ncbi:MAG: acyl-CoA dehydrogenase family protein [Candidatus Korobacteraceae bacterium]
MAVSSSIVQFNPAASFLTADVTPGKVFTREDLSPAQQMFGRISQDFMRTEVLPHEKEIYAKDFALVRRLLVKAGDLDLLRVDIPEAYDGLGLDKVSSAYVSETLGLCPSFPLGTHTTIGTLPIVYFGTEAQKTRYLPLLASGEKVGAYALTEPGAGSDALNIRTKATLSADGKHYLINGQKMWITNGGFADIFTIFAKIDGEKFTAFIVEREMGVVSGREEPKLGLDGSSTTALILENVKVPVENVLGEIGQGHKVAFNILNLGRLKLGTRNMGSAKQALNGALQYALERQQFGRAIAEFGMIQQKLAQMAVLSYVGDAMVFRCLGDVDAALAAAGHETLTILKTIESFAVECSINKVWTSEALAWVVDEAIQVHGGYGYSKEYPPERAYRDARITRIYEGTNEINRIIIAPRLLKNAAVAQLLIHPSAAAPPVADGLFPAERQILSAAKRLLLLTLAAAKNAYGDKLANEQEVLGHIADIAIETYAIESAVLRTSKLIAARGGVEGATPVDIMHVYFSDAADKVEHSARQVLAALAADEADRAPLQDGIRSIASHETFNTVAGRRRIATAVIKAGHYPY